MSNWSHVAAIARIDHIAVLGTPELDFEEIFGKEILYEADEELWEEANEYPERFLPMGSEGSLRMNVWVNSDPHAAARYTVSIFGDLRDHDDAYGITVWFEKKIEWLAMIGISIRQAIVTAHNEEYGYASWSYGDDDVR